MTDKANKKGKIAFISSLSEVVSEVSESHRSPWASVGGNTGNIIYWKAVKKITKLPTLTWAEFKNNYEKSYKEDYKKLDTIIFCDMTWIQPGSENPWLYSIFNLTKNHVKFVPFFLGLSTSNGTEDFVFGKTTLAMIKEISERGPIACRGEYTAGQLSRVGIKNTIILGCPSLYYHENPHFKITRPPLSKEPKIATHATLYPSKLATADLLNKFVSFCIKYETEFIEQTYFDWFSFLGKQHIEAYRDWKWHHKYFFNFDEWYDYMKNFDFTIGGRFHGAVIGILAGVSGLVLEHDLRVKEMCRYFDIPSVSFAEFDENRPLEYWYEKADYSEFNKRYMERYVAFEKFMECI